MKAKPQEQARLLELLAIDQLNQRERREAAEIKTGASLQKLAAEQREATSKILELSNALDSVALELKRSETDLELVEQRIVRDEKHLREAASARDAAGITSELEALAKRRSAIEDVELELLEKRDEIKSELAVAESERAKIEAELTKLNQDAVTQLNKLESGIALRIQARATLTAQIDQELVALYEKKAARGVPVGRLLGQECGACNMSLTAAPFAELSSVPADELATCPECQAILIR